MAGFPITEKDVSFLKALADPCRLEILFRLFEGEMCVCGLAARLGLDPSVVSHHLAVLKRRGLIVDRKEGRRILYSLHPGFYTKGIDTDTVEGGLVSVEFRFRRFREGIEKEAGSRSTAAPVETFVEGPPPSTGRKEEAILSAARDFMDALGFEIRPDESAVFDAYFRRLAFWSREPLPKEEERRRFEEGRRALAAYLESPHGLPEGEGGKPLFRAARRIVALLDTCRRAALRIGPIFAVKVRRPGEKIALRVLSDSLLEELGKIPSFMEKPEFLYDFLAGTGGERRAARRRFEGTLGGRDQDPPPFPRGSSFPAITEGSGSV